MTIVIERFSRPQSTQEVDRIFEHASPVPMRNAHPATLLSFTT
jgi:hypothetical protein